MLHDIFVHAIDSWLESIEFRKLYFLGFVLFI